MAEDISLDQEPKIAMPCTSQPQTWGKGSKKVSEPGPVADKNYSKKRDQQRYLNFDPRPENAPLPDTDSFLRDLQELRGNSMWSRLLRYKYDDYELSDGEILQV